VRQKEYREYVVINKIIRNYFKLLKFKILPKINMEDIQYIWFISGPTNLPLEFSYFFYNLMPIKISRGVINILQTTCINLESLTDEIKKDVLTIINILQSYPKDDAFYPRFIVNRQPKPEENVEYKSGKINYEKYEAGGCDCNPFIQYKFIEKEEDYKHISLFLLQRNNKQKYYSNELKDNSLIISKERCLEMNEMCKKEYEEGYCHCTNDFF